ncbi:hypothetical protein KSB_92700 [Ktedonobacter robiniae]|uniref:Uncharacterized protein n=1 Tax=Ktedonobacter robiniae TaxID=2778365 RepID=A0ABQ3V7G9_9CHLR|nr:hypothetical protein KSB_92700 [Ktedonobacter robiniae]
MCPGSLVLEGSRYVHHLAISDKVEMAGALDVVYARVPGESVGVQKRGWWRWGGGE